MSLGELSISQGRRRRLTRDGDAQMSTYELASVVIALAAVGVALASLITSLAVQRRQLALQNRLAEIEEARLQQETVKHNRADVRLYSTGDRLVCRNVGSVPARNVFVDFEPSSGGDSPIIGHQLREKFPIPELAVGNQVTLVLARGMTSASSQSARWGWDNPDGTRDGRSGIVEF